MLTDLQRKGQKVILEIENRKIGVSICKVEYIEFIGWHIKVIL